jgi:hypothetical protein
VKSPLGAAAAAVVAVIAATLLVDLSPDRTSPPTGVPESPASSPLPPPVRLTTVEEFCAAFSYFAASYTDQLANPDRESAAPLEAAGAALRTVGRPPGMTALDVRGLDLFVEDTLRGFRQVADTPGSAPSRTADDQLSLERFNAYVGSTCTPT